MSAVAGELSIDFGTGGNGERFTTYGWSIPERGEIWSTARRCALALPRQATPQTHVLRLALRPHVIEGRLPAQRMRVLVNGQRVADFKVSRRTIRACRIPWQALAHGPGTEISFELPDAARPADLDGTADRRLLGVALTGLQLYPDEHDEEPRETTFEGGDPAAVDVSTLLAADRLPLSELMLKFESLGQNCEFGLVQRECKAEPLGLLRFSSTPLPKLLAALDARFEGMGDPENIRVDLSSSAREYMINDERFGFLYHAFVESGAMNPEDLHRREARRVPFLVRKLLDDLTAGEKIFVFKGMGWLEEEEVFPLAMALRRYGPNSLLFINLATREHPAGTVEVRAPGFLVAYLSRFSPTEDAADFELAQWVKICRQVYRLWLVTKRKSL